MSAHVLISGTLFRAPEERTGKTSGKSFVAATIKVRDGEAAQFWRVLAFSDTAQSELLRLDDGDALAVQGGLRAVAIAPRSPFCPEGSIAKRAFTLSGAL